MDAGVSRETSNLIPGASNVIAAGLCSTGAGGLVYALDPQVSNLGLGFVALIGALAGPIGWALIRSRPMPWRGPRQDMRFRTQALFATIGWIGVQIAIGILPLRTYRLDAQGEIHDVDHPDHLLILLAGIWISLVVLDVLWGIVKRRRSLDIEQR